MVMGLGAKIVDIKSYSTLTFENNRPLRNAAAPGRGCSTLLKAHFRQSGFLENCNSFPSSQSEDMQ
jgi:hypothetical protein